MPGNADLGAFGDAPDDDAPPGATVCTVATRTDTFDRCRDGFYPCPASYPRTDREFEYMAFYRTAPTSAITHYAPVVGRERERAAEADEEGSVMSEGDWTALIEPFSEERTAVVFGLGDLVPLDAPVANDRTGVRGAWYSTIGDLRAAETLSTLAGRADTG
ncbi:MAG: hypothetical protein ABEH56_01005 [Salinirussus sp.]